jgi:hypothetical protein
MPSRRSLLRSLLAAGLVAATLVFLGLAIARHWSQIASYDWRIRPVELGASVLLLIAAMAWGVYVWHRVIARFDAPGLRFPVLLRIWFLSNLARYVPGKIWQFVGAVQLGRRAGIAPAVLLTSLVIHTGITLVSAALVSLVALPVLLAELGPLAGGLVAAAAILGIGAVHPRVLNFGLGLIPDRLYDQGLAWTGSWTDGIRLLALAVVAWLVYGAAFALFADSLVGIPLSAAPALVAANALAFLVGYMVMVTPGGLGAREAALALMLGPLGSLGIAAIIAVAFRLWLILGEVVGAGLVTALPGTAPREAAAPADAGGGPAGA